MNSPSLALVWEIWRKNCWGFALLLVLLGICVALARLVVHFQQEVDRLVLAAPISSEQSLQIQPVPPIPAAQAEGGSVRSGGLAPPPPSMLADIRARVVGRAYSEEVSQATMLAQSWREGVLAWSVTLICFSFLVVCAIFSGAEPHTARGFTGIPPRQLTLPVRTSGLVGWPIVLGCATVLLLYFAWSRLVLPALLPTKEKLPDLYFLALLSTGLVGFQALVWGLPSFPKTRVWLIVLFVFGGLPALGALWSKFPLGLAFVWLGSVAAAWFGVEQERRGGWASWKGWIAVEQFFHELRPRPLGFSSALHAQFWIEWRRNGRFALGVLVLLVMAAVGTALLLKLDPPRSKALADTIGPLPIMAFPIWLAITGLSLARDGSSKRLALSSFSATRPLPTGTLLTAKLLAGAVIWTTAVVILTLSIFTFTAINGEFRELPKWAVLLVTLVVSGHIFVGILPLCLSGRIPGFPWSLLPLLLVYGLVINAITWFGQHSGYYGLLFALLTTLVVLKVAVAFWAFRRALGLRLVSVGFVIGYLGFWLAGAGILLVPLSYGFLMTSADWANDAICLLPAAMLVVPLARIALSPLALAMNRHR